MGSDIPAVFPRDSRGRPIGEFPIMEDVNDFTAIAYVFNVSAGYPGTVEWVQFAGDRFHATHRRPARPRCRRPRSIPTSRGS